MEKEFQRELEESLYIHFPLKIKREGCAKERLLKKKAEDFARLWDGVSLDGWSFEGDGEMCVGDGCLKLHTWTRADHWPESEARAHDAPQGAYATFGSYIARLKIALPDTSAANRIYFRIRPECPGMHSVVVRVGVVNDGSVKIPDVYSREGFHAMNLQNHEWNECEWEIGSIAHDKLTEISFNIHRYGKDVSTGDDMFFELTDIRLQTVQEDIVYGWQCGKESAVFPYTGYLPEGEKTAVLSTVAQEFEIVRAESGETVYSGKIGRIQDDRGVFGEADFSELREPGKYRIRFGKNESEEFSIGTDVLDTTLWKLINFLYCERCGYPVPDVHGTCHQDVRATHDGVSIIFSGGWHDAADVSQQTVQSAEITDGLLAAAGSIREREPMMYRRLLEEANWGIDFLLRTRFGDGWRAANVSIRRWTDNKSGNMDDEQADVNNRSLENFICAAVEAFASGQVEKEDRELAWKCLEAAKDDFGFAAERFEKVGLEPPHMEEHTSAAPLSQYYAAAAWAAARLYARTREEKYAQEAQKYAGRMITCQETGENTPMRGYFYRDETKQHIVHSSHQSRDYIFAMTLAEMCTALADAPDRKIWEEAMRLHGEYLKKLSGYTHPYGMIPAGVYHLSEADDRQTFERVHPNADYGTGRVNYLEQLRNGISLGGGYYVRIFPVWFSFRGNSAIHLSMGKAASVIGKYFGDEKLLNIAAEQLYWTLGKNPFAQSLIYGEGKNYGQQYTALLGETVGEMPVGVQTRANEDIPYMPWANIATYREVWTTPPGRWMWIVSDLLDFWKK